MRPPARSRRPIRPRTDEPVPGPSHDAFAPMPQPCARPVRPACLYNSQLKRENRQVVLPIIQAWFFLLFGRRAFAVARAASLAASVTRPPASAALASAAPTATAPGAPAARSAAVVAAAAGAA